MKPVHILYVHNTKSPSVAGLHKYCEDIMERYGGDSYEVENYFLQQLKEQNFQQICASCYEGLFLSGIFTKEDLFWPIRRQRPKYKEVK